MLLNQSLKLNTSKCDAVLERYWYNKKLVETVKDNPTYGDNFECWIESFHYITFYTVVISTTLF